MLLDPDAVAAAIAAKTSAEDFSHPPHMTIFDAVLAVSGRGDAVGIESVAHELETRGKLATVGGAQYLSELEGRVSTTANTASIAIRLTKLGALRRAQRASESASAAFAAGDAKRGAELTAIAANEATRSERGNVLPMPPTPAERARALGERGKHLATRFATLDKATGGGWRQGDVVIVGGAPGTGKTTLGCNVACSLAAAGYHVMILASDESASGLVIRFGQHLGIERERLEAGDAAAREELAREFEGDFRTLMISDANEGYSVEDAAAALFAAAKGEPAALIVDSLQTVPAFGTDVARDARERVNAVVFACKRAARSGALVIATSELNRGAYSNRDVTKQVDSLAAFKESGAVEYGAAFAMVLRSVPDEHDLVDVTVVKNRIRGEKPEFRLKLNRDRAWFSEVVKPAEPDADERREDAAAARNERMRQRVLEAVQKHPGLRTRSMIARKVNGSRKPVLDAIGGLIDDGLLVLVNDAYRVALPTGDADGN